MSAQRRHSPTTSATRHQRSVREIVPARPPRCPSTETLGAARHDKRSEHQEGSLASRNGQRRGPPQRPQQPIIIPPYFLTVNPATPPNARTISDPLSAISSGRQSCSAPTAIPYQKRLEHRGMTGGASDRGLPSHPPKRTNGADRRSDHSGTTCAHSSLRENLGETNAVREENPPPSRKLITSFFAVP